jgi:3-phenylpropionate/trans-cinnamate dioxygenase ferredoxin reductase subunit
VPGVRALRTVEDAAAIRDLLGAGRSLAVVGAGFVGAELAASAATLGTKVTMFEAAPVPLARLLPAALGERYARLHREHGVDLHVGTEITGITAGSSGLRLADSRGGSVVAGAVVVAIGMSPDVSLAKQAGLALADGILVDEYCRTSAPDIYAAGDVACHPNSFLGRRIRIEHWQNAQHHGAAAARSMLGVGGPFAEVPWVWSDQYGVALQIAGIPEPGDEVIVRGDIDSLNGTAFLLRSGRLVAAVGLNRAGDVRAARGLIAASISPSREHLADEDLDLAALDPNTPAAA